MPRSAMAFRCPLRLRDTTEAERDIIKFYVGWVRLGRRPMPTLYLSGALEKCWYKLSGSSCVQCRPPSHAHTHTRSILLLVASKTCWRARQSCVFLMVLEVSCAWACMCARVWQNIIFIGSKCFPFIQQHQRWRWHHQKWDKRGIRRLDAWPLFCYLIIVLLSTVQYSYACSVRGDAGTLDKHTTKQKITTNNS